MGDDPVTAERVATVSDYYGFHCRPLSRFCRAAQSFNAEVRVSYLEEHEPRDGRPVTGLDGKERIGRVVDGKSIFGLSNLSNFARKGDRLRIEAEGPDAEEAVEALARIVEVGVGIHEARALQDLLPKMADFRERAEKILSSEELTENDREEIRSTIQRFREGLDQVERLVFGPPPLHRA